jgi:predicted membrane-bound spermidine synthase
MKKFLFFTVFVSGMTTLAVEISASRLIGSVFGTSNLVWASIIGLILIYLTLGYYFGGKWADKSPEYKTLYRILAWGSFFVGIVPYIAKPILSFAADAFDGLQIGILAGSFITVLVLFSIPVTLLGMISPFAIRLSIKDPKNAGDVSGKIYAISTLGSFLGTFLPVLFFIPLIGTTKTFLVFSLFLLFISIVGLIRSIGMKSTLPYFLLIFVIVALSVLLRKTSIKNSTWQIFEKESAYNYIQVLEHDGFYYLRLNEGQGIHSIYKAGEYDFGGPWQQFLVAPFFYKEIFPKDIKNMAIIGLAAGTTARQAAKVFHEVSIDGYEIDPSIVSVGKEYFGLDLANLNILIEDGRAGINRSKRKYDLIGIDAYRPPYIPWHMTTIEFFQIIFDHLSDNGALAINVGRAPNDRRLINGLFSTISNIFPSVYVMDIPGTFNSMIYATRNKTNKEDFNSNMILFSTLPDIDPLLTTSMFKAWINLQSDPKIVHFYTDDKAPIEWITNNMVLKYVLQNEQEIIQ